MYGEPEFISAARFNRFRAFFARRPIQLLANIGLARDILYCLSHQY
jgi:hypothetical protein